jgi:hypothetical protein
MAHPKQNIQANTLTRLAEWERRLADALSRTHVESERRRFQRELSELRTVRGELGRLSDGQLRTLYERLARDPNDWIQHRLAS